MEVLQLTAVQFIQPMSTGRNRPVLLGCRNKGGESFEVVVKLRGREMSEEAQTAELVAAQLAEDIGLEVPQAAVIDVPIGFEAAVPLREEAGFVKNSPGLNFGSVHLGAGFTTWPPGRNPVGAQRDQAAEIFTFDALVQNPDRRAANPNLWSRSDGIGVYDHEQAFSFLALPIIGGVPRPWSAANQGQAFRFLEQHIFYQALRGSRVNLGPIQERLGALSEEGLTGYLESIPAEWRAGRELGRKILEYLREAREQRESLVNFVKHLLR